jgi:hypothetical protein
MKFMTTADFARRTGLSYYLASRVIALGDIPSVKIGVRRMVSEFAIREWQETVCAAIGARSDHQHQSQMKLSFSSERSRRQ